MERASGSENGDLIETCMKEGKIVPVEITISLIEKVQHFVLNVCFGILFCFHSVLLLLLLYSSSCCCFFCYEKVEFERVSSLEYVIVCKVGFLAMT